MLTLADSYLHDLDPFAIGPIRWYGIAYAAGFLCAWMLIRWLAKSGRTQLEPDRVGDFMFYVIAGVLVGGRVGYGLFYDPAIFGFDSDFPWWRLVRIWSGGMSSHGGMLGVIIACILYGSRHRISKLGILDVAAVLCTPGLFLGRLANFVNAELWGRPLPAEMQANPPWWSIKYPQELDPLSAPPVLPGVPHLDPAKREEILRQLQPIVGGDASLYDRVTDAVRDGNAQVESILRPALTAHWPSQIIQAISDGPILFGLLVLIWLRPRKPGIVGAWFLIIYGVLRILTERFRLPDPGVALLLGLSRGQVLSVLMIAVGVIGLPIAARRNVERLGGLIRPTRACPRF